MIVALSLPVACSRNKNRGKEEPGATERPQARPEAGPDEATPALPEEERPLPVPPVTRASLREHPASHAWAMQKGKAPEKISLEQAEARGLQLVDLSDNWVPYIFSEKTPGQEDKKVNRYAKTYVGLANDRINVEGQKLRPHQHNFLELYGIPPTLSVLSQEWEEAQEGGKLANCLQEAGYDPQIFLDYPHKIDFVPRKGAIRKRRARKSLDALHNAMRKAKVPRKEIERAAEHPATAEAYKKWRKYQGAIDVITHAQKRLRCERLFPSHRGLGRSRDGEFDGEVALALASFERKHNLKGWGHFSRQNIPLLGEPLTHTVHDRLMRVLRERAISGMGILEDGSAPKAQPNFSYKDDKGKTHQLRDLATEATDSLLNALGLTRDPVADKARLDALQQLNPDGFASLVVAVPMPPRPPYYSESMAFETEIRRGDVWYDFPYDEEGNKKYQRRRVFPKITLFTHYLDQKIPIVSWRTTIGSWRTEEHDGHEYLVYKNSDVGSRVWKDIVAAPVWVPPMATPIRTLVKTIYKRRKKMRVVNYDETGPAHTSAYGLVAAYHIRQIKNEAGEIVREIDNQIRTHGSVDYMSIMRRYSHGCHRLYNMSAVQLFSFILQHRPSQRHGQIPLGYIRDFTFEEEDYKMKLDTRGYRYELLEPIKVTVFKGRVKGKRKDPYKEPMPIPGRSYEEESSSSGLIETGLATGTGTSEIPAAQEGAGDLTEQPSEAPPPPPI